MASARDYLLTATDQHGVQTPEAYHQKQVEYLARARPPLAAWANLDPVVVLISGGAWVLRCSCGNAPAVHPAWRVARCFECGAVYEGLEIPADAAALEDTLVQRPTKYRHWDPARGETVASLKIENKQAGLPHGKDDPERPGPPGQPGPPQAVWETPLARWRP